MKEIIRKEYMASVGELKELFPIGTICYIDNKTARVIEINEPADTNCMASYPSVTFVVVEPGININANKMYPVAHTDGAFIPEEKLSPKENNEEE